jgi:hypothetical protein
MLVAAIKADALASEDPTPYMPDLVESPFSSTPSRTTSAAVMNSTFSYTLLKRAQLSSIWSAVEFSALDAERYCALAHACIVALVKTANDAKISSCNFQENVYFPKPPPEYSNVDFKYRDNGGNVVLVAAIEIAATKQAVGDFVSMGLGGKWNAVFDDACNTTSLDNSSFPIVISTVRVKSTASSFRILQARDDSVQSEGEHKESQIIIALHSVGPLSVAGSADSSQDARGCSPQLLSGFVIEALHNGDSRVACVCMSMIRACCS